MFKHWAAISSRIEPSALREAWTKMEAHIMSPGVKPWARVKGPIAATFLHLKEMGWSAHFEGDSHVGFLDQEGALWKFQPRNLLAGLRGANTGHKGAATVAKG